MKHNWTAAILIAANVTWISQVSADQIQLLALPQQSLSAFAAAINGAKTSIDIATFIYEPCHPSVRILTAALAAKAKAGVRVRVLLDALQQSYDQRQNLADEFASDGIELAFYSSSLIDINVRLHAKFMIVDGQQYIAGGRNFSDEYFDLSSNLNYVDRDIWVTGDSAQEAETAFNLLWNSDMVSTTAGSASDFVDWNTFCSTDLQPTISTVQQYLEQNASGILQGVPARSCNIQFAVDNPDFSKSKYGQRWDSGNGAYGFLTESRLSRKLSTQAVLNFLSGTNSSLFVENYVYMPITNLEDAFAELRSRNIPVQVLVNQDIEDDEPDIFVEAEEYELAKSQSEDSVGSEWDGLISSQGSLSTAFSLTPTGTPFFMHEKVAVRDNRDVLIGSFNMDSRSANINVEAVATVTDCPDLVGDVMTNYNNVYDQYQQDASSSNVPAAPDPDFFAQILGDMLLTEF